MTSKFRKFLDLINEQLHFNDETDNFVSFTDVDFHKEGLSIHDIERFKNFLVRKGIMFRLSEWRGDPNNPLPSQHKEKLRTFSWWWPLNSSEGHTVHKYVFELTSRENFLGFYHQTSLQEDAFEREERGPGGDGGSVFIVAKEIKGNGKILADGGDGSTGGKGGRVHIVTEKNEYAGDVSARGGRSDIPPTFNIKNSQLHFGHGDNVGRDKNENSQQSLLGKYWWRLLIPVFVILIASFITNGEIPRLFQSFIPTHFMISSSATSTINLADIYDKANGMSTSLDQESFLEKYEGSSVYGEGSFSDIGKFGNGYSLIVNVSQNDVSCFFDNINTSTEQSLLLLQRGEIISFSGIYTTGMGFGSAGYVKNCSLK